jgi:hypothetical protein
MGTQADMHFVKSIRKRFNMIEANIKEDPDYMEFTRENLFL